MPLTQAQSRQYRVAREECALLSRADRGLLQVTGRDRASWLHNLVTNSVKTLSRGDGVYAFAVNIKGRVLFDLNILALDAPAAAEGSLWLDIDAGWIADAQKHFDRYIISEDVQVRDITANVARLALIGPRSVDLAGECGVSNLAVLPALQSADCSPAWAGARRCRMVRHDILGIIGAELFMTCDGELPRDAISRPFSEGVRPFDVCELDPAVAEIIRIEEGVPASRRDIDAEVTPPETGQIERGINYHKGCYLGQEVIERMRSHGVVPRKLVSLSLEAEPKNPLPVPMWIGESDVGRMTSACWSPRQVGWLGLGYLKSAHAAIGKRVAFGASPASVQGAEVIR